MRSWLTYTAARLGLFAGALGLVYLFGARTWVALILAWLISGLASYVLLSKLRDRMSASTVSRIEKRRDVSVAGRLEDGAAREDGLQEAVAASGSPDAAGVADAPDAADVAGKETAPAKAAETDPEPEPETKKS